MSSQRPLPQPVPPNERHGGANLGADHTRVPNRILDLVMPRVTPAEQACLLFILRRTYGFASPTVQGQRKLWDRISLSQFYDENVSGGYVLNLGAGLSKSAAIKGLLRLEQRQIVRVSYECPTHIGRGGRAVGCGWNEGDDDHLQRPTIDPKTKAARCPRCGRTLSKAYSIRVMTPGFIKRFLTETDPKGRTWGYDPKVDRFFVGEEPARQRGPSAAETASQLRAQLWHPEKLDRIIADASSVLASKRISESRIVKGFYQPVIDLQESGLSRQALAYGLDVVIERGIAKQSHNRNWHGYAKACAQTWMERKHGGKEQVEAEKAASSVELELERCAELNGNGEHEHARQVLHEIITSALDSLAADYDGDRWLARRHILEAFKRGVSDYRCARDYTTPFDFLPQWTWEDDEQRQGADQEAAEV